MGYQSKGQDKETFMHESTRRDVNDFNRTNMKTQDTENNRLSKENYQYVRADRHIEVITSGWRNNDEGIER